MYSWLPTIKEITTDGFVFTVGSQKVRWRRFGDSSFTINANLKTMLKPAGAKEAALSLPSPLTWRRPWTRHCVQRRSIPFAVTNKSTVIR